MKKLAFIFVATLLLGWTACDNSSDDPPTPVEDYTVKYSVVSTGSVNMDTIKYMDADGTEKYLLGEANFEHSFVQPSNNYHGKIYISGTIENGSCNYSLTVQNKDGGIISYNGKENSATSPYSFQWLGEYIHTED
jgi:hypothetical protein